MSGAKVQHSTPKVAGKAMEGIRFMMPAEHATHARTLTAWPDRSHYPDLQELRGIEADIAAISNAIAEFEPVTLFVKNTNVGRAQNLVSAKVEIQEADINEPWIRDTGPVYVKDGENSIVGLDLNFNYWGNKLEQSADSKVASLILRSQGVRRVQTRIVAEGGAIEVDGEGTLLMTESSILNDNRNPGVKKEEMERRLKESLGVNKVVWLPGIKGCDITDSHIDGAARFIAPGRLLLSRPAAASQKRPLRVYQEAKKILETSTDAMGRKFQIVEIPEGNSQRLPVADPYQVCLSYANYLLVNGGVVIPAFGDREADETAFAEIQEAFPGRRVSQVLLTALWRHGGGIHCTTQQQPV